MECCQSGTGCKPKGLCPLSLGLALAITMFLFVFISSAWMMHYGMPMGMQMFRGMTMSWGDVFARAICGALSGFVFGIVLALIYDGIICCCKFKCCKPSGCGCQCGCKKQSDVMGK